MTPQLALTFEVPADAPKLWEEFGSRELMCSWCGAASVEQHIEIAAEGADCQRCHFAPWRRQPR